jgi:Peptidase M50B-like
MSPPTAETRSVLSATPCLDRQIPFPRINPINSELRWWQLALVAALLFVKTFFVIYAVELLCVLVHEAGHVIGAVLAGLRFNYIRVGPVQVEQSGKISWRWTWRALGSGATSALPVSRSARRWRLCLFVAAGPAANLVCAFLVFKALPRDNSMLAAGGLVFVALSTLVGILNLLPIRSHGIMLDGLEIWILLFGKKRRERLIFLLTFAGEAKRGDLKSFVQDSSLEQSSRIKDGSSQQVVANWLAYAKATAAEDHEVAALHLESCLVASPAIAQDLREELIIEAAQFQALRRKRPDLAREWLALEQSGKARARRFHAEALILYGENQGEQALAKAEQGLASIGGVPEGTAHNIEEQALRNLKDALQKYRAGNPDHVN